MFKITFCDTSDNSNTLHSSGLTIDSKAFADKLKSYPSDRHAYSLRFYKNPISIGRLPNQAKMFVKYIR